ncbi:MAG: transposase, partial [Candidatus Marsarchaeota archaeon]|nr:transposase [Candidatus Marsarchaeota archaeon]
MEIDEEILSLNPDELETDEKTKALIRKVLNLLEQVLKENAELRVEIQKLRDENARLKGEKGKPRVLPNVKGINAEEDKEEMEKKTWFKGPKVAQISINRTETVEIDTRKLPKDAVFKGYRRVTVQELKFESDNVQFLIGRYYSKSKNKTYEGELPNWVDGNFGPKLKAFIINLYFAGRVPEKKIRIILTEMGIVISAGEISDIITKEKQKMFTKERDDIFNAGMESTSYVHADDTMLRHKGVTNHVMVLCTALFGVFFVNRYKNRDTVREILGLKLGQLFNKILISDNA